MHGFPIYLTFVVKKNTFAGPFKLKKILMTSMFIDFCYGIFREESKMKYQSIKPELVIIHTGCPKIIKNRYLKTGHTQFF